MKISSNPPLRSLFTAVAIASCLGLSAMTARADTYVFNNGAGGDGTWENGAGGSPWQDGGTQNLPWDNSANNYALFQGNGGTVDVAGDVTASYMEFNTNSDETLNGTGTITISTSNGVLQNDTNNNVTIDNNLDLVASTSDRFDISNNGSGTVTLNGNITYVGSAVNASGQGLIFNGGSTANYILNGSFSGSSGVPARLLMYGSGTLTLNGDYTNTNPNNFLEVDAGTVYLGTSKTGTGVINLEGGDSTVPTLLTVGAQTITNTVDATNYTYGPPFTSSYVIIGGSTADLSSYSSIQSVVTGVTLTAAANGRVDIGTIGNSVPTGLVKTGAGTVNLQGANTYSINNYSAPPGTVAADIQQGTLLINNGTTGSGFGNNSGTVNVEAGATLGGNGSTGGTQQVVVNTTGTGASTVAGIIAPGDAGQANLGIAPKIGTLTLAGGLSATSGATFDFKLDNVDGMGNTVGTDSDYINFGGDVTFGGTVTINFASLGSIVTGQVYTLMYGGNWTGTPTSLVIDTPAGYSLDDAYNGTGYDFNDGGDDTFSVEFVATPEPSTYGLMGLGLLALVGIRRLRSRLS